MILLCGAVEDYVDSPDLDEDLPESVPRQNRSGRVDTIVKLYGCTREDANRYLDLRDEGHSVYAAGLMAGISDPAE